MLKVQLMLNPTNPKYVNFGQEFLLKKDLTSLLEFVITLVIIEINGANFAPISF